MPAAQKSQTAAVRSRNSATSFKGRKLLGLICDLEVGGFLSLIFNFSCSASFLINILLVSTMVPVLSLYPLSSDSSCLLFLFQYRIKRLPWVGQRSRAPIGSLALG